MTSDRHLHLVLVTVVALCAGRSSAECVFQDDEGTIDCNLRILDFRRNSSDSVPGVERAKAINVLCSDVFFFESQLRSDHFGSLPSLQELSIRFCKIRQLPPRSFVSLERLASLTVNTFNAEWTSLELEPDYESLVGLEHLKYLDLSQNNIRALPRGLLCPLSNIDTVNLTRNGILDLEDLGLSNRTGEGERCEVHAAGLVLSRNEITSAPPGALASLHRLERLDLSFNHLAVLVESAFRDLGGLRVLNLAHNRLVALPPKIFTFTPRLKELWLSNNSIGTIDIRAFRNLSQLQVLNLSGNSLDENWIKPGIFDGLRALILLDLSANHISKVESKLFADLGSLQVLNLAHNQIHTVSSNAFSAQLNLHIMVLSHNQLESLHHQTLTGLSVLSSLSLDHNRLHSLHPVALKNCSALTELSLNNNFLTQVPKALHHMPSLQSLDLSSNVIGVLKRESLQVLPQLHTLKISRNELSRIGDGAFKETPALLHLDLSANRLQSLEQETFKSLKDLKSLDVAENQLEDINGLLQTQVGLQWLNVSSNLLPWFDYAFVPPSVQYLDISDNLIDALGNYYNLAENYALRYLDASGNKIESLEPVSLLPSMEDVLLQGNNIAHISDNTFIGKSLLNEVHLERNELTTLSMGALMTSPLKATPMFYFGSNPFVCNCHLYWFTQINSNQQRLLSASASAPASSSHFPHVVDMDRISCSVLNNQTTTVQKRPLTHVPREQFLCRYDSHCLPGCMCCDFFACDCQIRCPKECRCFRGAEWATNVVQCSDGGHVAALPEGVPVDATEIYLDRNNFTSLEAGMLVGRARLRKLSVRHSHVSAIQNQTFGGLGGLRVLLLDHNQLQHLYGHEFLGLRNLRRLHLNHNQLVSIQQDTFKRLKKLTQLKLDNNLLISFPIWELSSNPSISALTLADNWWRCDCDFVRKFRMFIDGKPEGVVEDAKNITCTSSDAEDSAGGGGLREECSGILNGFHYERTFGNDAAPLVVGVAVTAVLLLLVVVLALRAREPIQIWLHDKYGIRICRATQKKKPDEDENSTLFDALVIYSLKDEKLVTDELVKSLEPSYRLCLHHRDLSGIYTSEAFKSAMAASEWQIVILSEGLLATEWDYVKDLLIANCLIVVADGMDLKVEDQKVRAFMKSAKRVVRWSEPSFWRKLRYFLPDPTKVITKEGGAELDVSGAWTFTNTTQESNPDSTAASTARLITSPAAGEEGQLYGGAASMLSMLQQHGNFPAPPVRKQPHQCSTHYLAGAPSSPQTRSPCPATRSCGTNFGNLQHHHQRSSSAVVARNDSTHHARSSSYAARASPRARAVGEGNARGSQPTPPNGFAHRNSVYNDAGATLMSRLQQSAAAESAFKFGSGHELRRPSSPPMSSLAMIPLRANNLSHHHQRSTSLLDPAASATSGTPVTSANGGGRYAKHGRSVSNLSPMNAATAATPRLIKAPVTRTSSMMVSAAAAAAAGGVRSSHGRTLTHHMSASNLVQQATRPPAEGARPQPQGASGGSGGSQNRSFSSLVPSERPPMHFRSKSTPHEGFVL